MNNFDLKGFINENSLGAHSKYVKEAVGPTNPDGTPKSNDEMTDDERENFYNDLDSTDEGLEKGYFKKKHGIGEQKQRVMEALGKRMAEGSYPFEKCIRDQEKRYGDKETAQRVCGAIRAAYGE
jgi:hypothetical protein